MFGTLSPAQRVEHSLTYDEAQASIERHQRFLTPAQAAALLPSAAERAAVAHVQAAIGGAA